MTKRNWLTILLLPFSWIYGAVTSIRNGLFDLKLFKTENPPQFTISIGNLTVGGTGKTPMTEYLVRLLSPTQHLGILSRGYGRRTKGFLLADTNSSAEDIGDEPLQYFKKFGETVPVTVCEKRVKGAHQLYHLRPDIKVLLLDDAYQHRAIGQNLKILLNDYNRPFYEDYPFPAGRLRETRNGANRADVVIVSKTPTDLSIKDRIEITQQIQKYSKKDIPIFFSSIRYADPVDYLGRQVALKNVKLVAGIANPHTFVIHAKALFNVVDEIFFPDHHNYSLMDVDDLIKNLKNDTFVVTTEKDMVKLKPLVEKAGSLDRFAYIPITVDFGDDTVRFNQFIQQQLTKTN